MITVTIDYETSGLSLNKLVNFNPQTLLEAKSIFDEYKQKGILTDCLFDDNEWNLYNGYTSRLIRFNYDELVYFKTIKNRHMPGFHDFLLSVKAYTLFCLGKYVGTTLSVHLHKLNVFLHETKFLKLNKKDTEISLFLPGNIPPTGAYKFVLGYLEFSEWEDGVQYLDTLKSLLNGASKHRNKPNLFTQRRNLAEFQSVFCFEKYITVFWSGASKEERLKYFPLYFWWKVTNIIPLRVGELMVTPLGCVRQQGEEYVLTLRRSELKGGVTKARVLYKVEEDYKLYDYIIPKEIADIIIDYQDEVSKYNEKFLFSKNLFDRCFYLKNNIKKNKYFLKDHFYLMLDYFYAKVLNERYGLMLVDIERANQPFKVSNKKVTKSKESRARGVRKVRKVIPSDFVLKANQITKITPGELRHFSMINMAISGVNPMIIKEFARHDSINTTYHYFGNIGNLVRCYSYTIYEELCNYNREALYDKYNTETGVSTDKILARIDKKGQPTEVDHGWCISKKFKRGDVKDCQKVAGHCSSCDFFERNAPMQPLEKENALRVSEHNLNRYGKLLGEIFANYKNDITQDAEMSRLGLNIQQETAKYMYHIEKYSKETSYE